MEPETSTKCDSSDQTAKLESNNETAGFKSFEDYMKKSIQEKHINGKYVELDRYFLLRRAIQQNDWDGVQDFISRMTRAPAAEITELSQTLFHLIVELDNDGANQLMEKVAPTVNRKSLEHKDVYGCTALLSAAAVGNTKAAKILVRCNKALPNISNNEALLPIHIAAKFCHKETVQYLLSVTNEDTFAGESGVTLLKLLIAANLYDITVDLLKRHPKLARDENSYRRSILDCLARKPLEFASGCRLDPWEGLIYKCIPVKEENPIETRSDLPLPVDTENPNGSSENCSNFYTHFEFVRQMATTFGAILWKRLFWNPFMQLVPIIKDLHDSKLTHMQTIEIVKMMCDGVNWTYEEAEESLKMPILTAARLGIYEIVNEITNAYPYSFFFEDEEGNNIFTLAVLHRHIQVFNLIYKKYGKKKLVTTSTCFKSKSGNNILHLAGMLLPSSQVPISALQMQRELQWFKVVKTVVHPSLQEERNFEKLTPREVFSKEHKILVDDAQKWMKKNASWSTIVATLIISVAFAAACNVPGGFDDAGIPHLLHETSFLIFVSSDLMALYSSIASLMLFLGILNSRYSEEDFLRSLPRMLNMSFLTLFNSIAGMMIAFAAIIYIGFSGQDWVLIPITLFSFMPMFLFFWFQLPLLAELYSSTSREFFNH